MRMYDRCQMCGKSIPSDRHMIGKSTCGIVCDKKRHSRNQEKRQAKARENYRKRKEMAA